MLTAFLTLYVGTFVYLLPDMIDMFSGDTSSSDDPVDDPEPAPNPNTPDILVEASETYTGSPDADLIETPDGVTVSDAQIFGNEGADIINVAVSNSLIDGFTQNDQITVQGDDNIIKGRDGDDIITLLDRGGNSVDGGAGNDTFQITEDRIDPQNASDYDGGKGTDVFNWMYTVNETSSDEAVPPITLVGGDDSDTFNLTLDIGQYTGQTTAPGQVLTLTDFDKDEDMLVLDVTDSADPEDGTERPYSDVVIRDNNDGSGSQIIIRYAATDTAPAIEASIGLTGVTGLTLDDIAILEPA